MDSDDKGITADEFVNDVRGLACRESYYSRHVRFTVFIVKVRKLET